MTGLAPTNIAVIGCLMATLSGLFFSLEWSFGSALQSYRGREDHAAWRASALARIDKIRKGDLSVEVVDQTGRTIPGATVKIDQKRHAFSFGAAVSAKMLNDTTPDGERYRQVVENSYNKVVLENDLKWGEWERDPRNIDASFKALEWLRNRDIAVRGHYVSWGPLDADGGTVAHAQKDGPQFRSVLLRHAEEKVRRVGNLVGEWDVVNHPVGWGPRTIRDIGGNDIYDTMFLKVAEWSPTALRFINEGGVLNDSGRGKRNDRYFRLIGDLLNRRVPVQGIGFMGHFFADRDLTPPEELLQILDRYAGYRLPLQVTEFDVRYGKMGELLVLNPEQERLQADYTRDFLIALFSHPSVTGVVMWGFWEGRHWYPAAALYRKDWSIKPNGKVWNDLVRKQWWTTIQTGTDAKGWVKTRAFLGRYDIQAYWKGKSGKVRDVVLDANGAKVRVVLGRS